MNIHDKKSLILVDNISKYYGSFKALDSVRFTVNAGERVAVAGPSGSGKSSLLNSLAGIIHPEKGQVLVDGNDLAKLQSRKEMCRLVGIIHQQYDLVPQLPVIHNVLAGNLGRWGLFNSLLSLVWPRDRRQVQDILGELGIADKIDDLTSKLSGGEQQRVAIARMMIQSPQLVLADEPVASLDPARAEEGLKLITDLTIDSNKTLVITLHSPHLISAYCSRVIGLREGKLIFDLPTSEVDEHYFHQLYDIGH